jgi:hypothetical protein
MEAMKQIREEVCNYGSNDLGMIQDFESALFEGAETTDHWFVISYNDRWYKIFVALKTAVLILQSQLYTFIAAFRFNWTQESTTYYVADAIELFILVDIITKFVREYTPPGAQKPVRDWKKCALEYGRTLLLMDIVYILPLQKIFLPNHRADLFFLLKQPRCFRLFIIADVRSVANAVGDLLFRARNYLKNRVKQKDRDFKFQYNIVETNNYRVAVRGMVHDTYSKNDFEILSSYMVRLSKSVFILFELAFQLGLFFLCAMVALEEFHDGVNYREEELANRFLVDFGLYGMSIYEALLRIFYYMFTTITTIGFGDFHPKSDIERMMVAFILLFGVMMTALIMGDLIELLQNFETFMGEYEEYEKLAQFFSTLEVAFNEKKSFNHKLRV